MALTKKNDEVVLMVSITVILAAVISAFVFGTSAFVFGPPNPIPDTGTFIISDKDLDRFSVLLMNADGSMFSWAHATDLKSWNSLEIGKEYSCNLKDNSNMWYNLTISNCVEIPT
jgi:hypothetical protein